MSTFLAFIDAGGNLIYDFPRAVTAYQFRLQGCEVEVEIRERRTKRSDRQNKGFHAMITPWAHSEGHVIDELKRDLLCEIFGTLEHVNPISGVVTLAPKEPHTSRLTVQQFSELIERTLEIAAGCGVVLMAPDEYRKAKETAEKQAARKQRVA
jgi:hypothetical protein